MEKKPMVCRYNNKFDPKPICRFLGGKLVGDEILLGDKVNNIVIVIKFRFDCMRSILCRILRPNRQEIIHLDIEDIKKIWYKRWCGEKVVVFEKASGAQLAVRTDNAGYKVMSYDYDYKLWGQLVG